MEPNKELEKAIESKFLSPAKFAMEIEKLVAEEQFNYIDAICYYCLLYTSPSPRDRQKSRMPSSA